MSEGIMTRVHAWLTSGGDPAISRHAAQLYSARMHVLILLIACVIPAIYLAVDDRMQVLNPQERLMMPGLAVVFGALAIFVLFQPARFLLASEIGVAAFVIYLITALTTNLTHQDAIGQMQSLATVSLWLPLIYISIATLCRLATAIVYSVLTFFGVLLGTLIPLRLDDPVYGTIVVLPLASMTLSQLCIIALVLGFGVLRHRHRRTQRAAWDLKKEADTDALTRLTNRRAMVPAISATIARLAQPAERHHRTTGATLMLFDIDHFKLINDTCGHATGDEVLIRLARLLDGAMGPHDVSGRWGGEEFMVLSTARTLDEAEDLAELIRQRMRAQPWPRDLVVRASFGITPVSRSDSVDSAVGRADAALYQAKHLGRDRIESMDIQDIVPGQSHTPPLSRRRLRATP